jgi:hypothetical protein
VRTSVVFVDMCTVNVRVFTWTCACVCVCVCVCVCTDNSDQNPKFVYITLSAKHAKIVNL